MTQTTNFTPDNAIIAQLLSNVFCFIPSDFGYRGFMQAVTISSGDYYYEINPFGSEDSEINLYVFEAGDVDSGAYSARSKVYHREMTIAEAQALADELGVNRFETKIELYGNYESDMRLAITALTMLDDIAADAIPVMDERGYSITLGEPAAARALLEQLSLFVDSERRMSLYTRLVELHLAKFDSDDDGEPEPTDGGDDDSDSDGKLIGEPSLYIMPQIQKTTRQLLEFIAKSRPELSIPQMSDSGMLTLDDSHYAALMTARAKLAGFVVYDDIRTQMTATLDFALGKYQAVAPTEPPLYVDVFDKGALKTLDELTTIDDETQAKADAIRLTDAQLALADKFAERLVHYAMRLAQNISNGAKAEACTPIGFSRFDIIMNRACRSQATFDKLLKLGIVAERPQAKSGNFVVEYMLTPLGLAVTGDDLPVHEVSLPRFNYRDVLRSSETGLLYRVTHILWDAESRRHIYTLHGFTGSHDVASDDSRLDSLNLASADFLASLDAIL